MSLKVPKQEFSLKLFHKTAESNFCEGAGRNLKLREGAGLTQLLWMMSCFMKL